MRRKTSIFLVVAILISVVVPAILCIQFKNTSSLLIAAVTHQLPDRSHLSRIRNALLEQGSFRMMLIKHEEEALEENHKSGAGSLEKLRHHITPTSMFDIRAFHDIWEVWVRTDIVQGRPLTSFLIRLGIIKDTNACDYFGGQCESAICRFVLCTIVGVYNQMFDWGIFMPIRLNITELDATSSVSKKMVSREEWSRLSEELHRKGQGITFMKMEY